MKHVAEPVIRRNVAHYPTELPKLNMVVPGPQTSFPVSFPAGTLPAIASKKCQSRLAKVELHAVDSGASAKARDLPFTLRVLSPQPRDESQRTAFKTYYMMPPLERKHGGY